MDELWLVLRPYSEQVLGLIPKAQKWMVKNTTPSTHKLTNFFKVDNTAVRTYIKERNTPFRELDALVLKAFDYYQRDKLDGQHSTDISTTLKAEISKLGNEPQEGSVTERFYTILQLLFSSDIELSDDDESDNEDGDVENIVLTDEDDDVYSDNLVNTGEKNSN